ncbi:CoA-transferase family III domain-containing protein [Chaetomium fimeti]|uniref:CoA-transferase family III domain-containing protein n=1 Tax=Chaetomium fimeti TaxID=1854472 RepID=A0AAE0LTH4_9PEZI|nr:CoA-transferase family III domain-containing protein [Chaetomium fimeti]
MPGQPPLTGIKVLEFAGLAPGPFAGLLLADAGATVLRIDRPPSPSNTTPPPPAADLLTRHKRSLPIDLAHPQGRALVLALARQADVLIDPYRPGVLERLRLGPDVLCAVNPRLVYARLTGFRRGGRGGGGGGGGDGGGRGQVVEVNMVDGTAYLASFARFAGRTPVWDRPRGENLLDSGCPWYECYETADGRWMAVGALEPRFFGELVKGLGLEGQGWEKRRYDRAEWPELRRVLEGVFKSRTRAEWEAVFEGTDACCTPVYEYGEMEEDMVGKEGDQRPAVTLRDTPLLAVRRDAEDASHGQGPGVEGEGYVGQVLEPGQGGEETLKEWMGWSRG